MPDFEPGKPEKELFESECLIDPAELQIGHFVSRLDRPWRDSPFPLEGVMILSEEQRSWFVEECQWVVIDLLRGRNAWRPPSARSSIPPPPESRKKRWLNPINMLRHARLTKRTVSAAVDCHNLLYRQAALLVDSLRRTGRIDVEKARLGLRQIASSLESNIAAMIWLTRIKHADQRTAEHSVNVAILAMGLARALDWEEEEVGRAGLAGLLHDLGKIQMDTAVVNKVDPLTEAEEQLLRRHSQDGYDLLRTDSRIEPEVARAVLEHHEQPDGQGYPDGKRGEELQPLSMLVAVVNAYDSMTSDHPRRATLSHHEALGALWRQRRRQFDAGMVETLIQFLGWVTPGIVVRLTDNSLAVVLETSQEHRLWPIVCRLKREGDAYVSAERLDLANQGQSDGAPVLRIDQVLPDGAVEADLNTILLREAVRERADAD
ncbi:MAG: HD-GYP domain-containing protein [Wenzhouxiangellaceae bacterium]